jgi:alpha-glucosidase
VRLRWLGVSGWEPALDGHSVLVDPYPTRRQYKDPGDKKMDAGQAADPASPLATLTRLLRTRRVLAHRLADLRVTRVERGPGVTAFRRDGLEVLVALGDGPTGEIELSAPAVFDADDPGVSPELPRTGRLRLAPQQALVPVHP